MVENETVADFLDRHADAIAKDRDEQVLREMFRIGYDKQYVSWLYSRGILREPQFTCIH